MIINAILIGFVLGALEFLILKVSGQKLGKWVYIQSLLFWFTAGVMIGLIESPLPSYLSGALIAVFLASPWFINISIATKDYKHLAPLIISSLVLGVIGGYIKILLLNFEL